MPIWSVFYLGYFWAAPSYLIKKRNYGQFFLALIVIFSFDIAFFIVQNHLFKWYSGIASFTNDLIVNYLGRLLSPIMFLTAGIGVRLTKEFYVEKENQANLKTEVVKAQLKLLKSQLNPHFTFNTLNNIYSLSLQNNSELTSESILILSKLLRYFLDVKDEKQIPISKEVEFINDYIFLERLRVSQPSKIPELIYKEEDVLVAPLLLLTFIENAFKHSDANNMHSNMHFQLNCHDGQLDYLVMNEVAEVYKPESTGIGIENLRQRLSLLYPEKHTLTTRVVNGIYKAELKLKID